MDHRFVRKAYLDYFVGKGHKLVSSSPVVPLNDPTLLFTNAGMNQFKDLLLGTKKESYTTAVSVQKCIRAGGKHNDLDEVGKDGRHMTFFEMLGNWSFGDYYKEKAIEWAWDFSVNYLKLDPSKIYASVYKDDDESYNLWRDRIGLPDARIVRLGNIDEGDDENFWSMGPTGPCGPSSELHFDQGPTVGCGRNNCRVGCGCDRYLEFWNLVFMEFNRTEDGKFHPLAFKSVDTGMGLERALSLITGKSSAFDTNVFAPMRRMISELSHPESGTPASDISVATNVLCDHVRTLTFAVTDGAIFSNEGRGYVLRRILRRAVRYSKKLGHTKPFLHMLVDGVIEAMGEAYPEIIEARNRVKEAIRIEEEKFFATLEVGLELFQKTADVLGQKKLFPGDIAFKLHDTYGFPVDLTQIMAEEQGITVDTAAFNKAMNEQRERARAAMKFYAANDESGGPWQAVAPGSGNTFVGYERWQAECRVLRFKRLEEDRYAVILDQTTLYPEGGGQVADTGEIFNDHLALSVVDVQKNSQGEIIHEVIAPKELNIADFSATFWVRYHQQTRLDIARHHTATHVLHKILRATLGETATQAGSKVASGYLRFDFHYNKRLSEAVLAEMEQKVNEAVAEAKPVVWNTVTIDEAKRRGAMALFGEKYGDQVRMVQIGEDYSLELCGGTHVSNTATIGYFKIVAESSVAAGVRRIEAVANRAAQAYIAEKLGILDDIRGAAGVEPHHVATKMLALTQENKDLRKKLAQLGNELFRKELALSSNARKLGNGLSILVLMTDAADRDEFLQKGDIVRDASKNTVFCLGWRDGDKLAVQLGLSADLAEQGKLNAGSLVKDLCKTLGGSGGGKPHLAQGSLGNSAAFERVEETLVALLS